MEKNKLIKKKIIYRSLHRGTKELDLLISKFVEKIIDHLNPDDLNDLNTFVNYDDEYLKNLYYQKKSTTSKKSNNVVKMFKEFKL